MHLSFATNFIDVHVIHTILAISLKIPLWDLQYILSQKFVYVSNTILLLLARFLKLIHRKESPVQMS